MRGGGGERGGDDDGHGGGAIGERAGGKGAVVGSEPAAPVDVGLVSGTTVVDVGGTGAPAGAAGVSTVAAGAVTTVPPVKPVTTGGVQTGDMGNRCAEA